MPDEHAAPRLALFLRHHDEDDPGLVGEALSRRGFAVEVATLGDGAAPIELDGIDVLGILGAKWSVYDEQSVGTWFAEELAAIARADERGVPILGICFGAQALCVAFGGEVTPAPRSEVGWVPLEGNEHEGIPAGEWFQFHGDRCHVPASARVLASNDVCVQAFRVGRHLAVQFHPEIDGTQLARWFASEGGADDYCVAAGVDPVALLEETVARTGAAAVRTDALVGGFLERARAPRA